MKTKYFIIALLSFIASVSTAQSSQEKVVITGVRFAYPLVQRWIDRYREVNPNVNIIIESRTTSDPASYDILIEGYAHDADFKSTRDYLYIGRFAVLPFANSSSPLANAFRDKGLSADQLKEIFFHDPLAERKDVGPLPAFTVYTRLQKAAAPITFAGAYGYAQQDISGKAISGGDEHLVKAAARDSLAVSYASLNLIYDHGQRKVYPQVTVLPTDLDGNKKISPEEKDLTSLDQVIALIERSGWKNVPSDHLHLSVPKVSNNTAAVKFLHWVAEHGQDDLHAYGFLLPDQNLFEREREKFLGRAAIK